MIEVHGAAVILVTLLTTSACGPVVPGSLSSSDLHNGDLTYVDPAYGSSSFPDRVAVGATFGVEYVSDRGDVDQGVDHIVSLSSKRITSVSAPQLSDVAARCCGDSIGWAWWFRTLLPGVAAIEARGADNRIVDFIDVTVVNVAAMALHACAGEYNTVIPPVFPADVPPVFRADVLGGPESADCRPEDAAAGLTIARGESLAPTVCVTQLDDTGRELAGNVPIVWSSKGAATLEIDAHDDPNCVTVGGLTLGSATLTATGAGVSGSLPVEVTQ